MADGGGRLPLTILAGDLGAGKSSWARHHLRAGHWGPAPEVIVNEAAGIAVDDLLLAPAGRVTVLAGGCACCAGRGALVTALRGICDRRARGQPVGPVLLETSGLADPGAIAAALGDDPVLVHHLALAGIVVMVDALHGPAHLAAAPLARAQVAAADRLVVTRSAEAPDPAPLLATLAALNPGAAIEAAEHGVAVPLPPCPPGTPPLPLAGGEPGPPPRAEVLVLPPGLDWAALTLWLSALLHARGDRIARVKGVVATPAGRLLLQSVRRAVAPPEILPGPPDPATDGRLAVIGLLPAEEGALARSLHRFLGLADPA